MHFKSKIAIAPPVLALLTGLSAIAPAESAQTVTEIFAGQTGVGETPETLVESGDEIVVAANKKRGGPKGRPDHGIQGPAPKDCIVQKRKGTKPKGDKDHGRQDCAATNPVPIPVKRKGGPKPDVGHGIQAPGPKDCVVQQRKGTKPKGAKGHGRQNCAAIDPVPIPVKRRGPKERDKELTN